MLSVVYRREVLAQLAHKTCTRNTPGLHTRNYQLCMYAKHARPTYIIEAIVHARETRPAYTRATTNSSCTQNTPDLHTRNYQLINQRARPTPLAGPPASQQKKKQKKKKQKKNNQRPAYMHNVREAFAAAPTPTPSAMPSAAPKASLKITAQEKIRRTDKKKWNQA